MDALRELCLCGSVDEIDGNSSDADGASPTQRIVEADSSDGAAPEPRRVVDEEADSGDGAAPEPRESRGVVDDAVECPVCLSTFAEADMTTLACGHEICDGCFARQDGDVGGALRRCALCRARFLNAGAAGQPHHPSHDDYEALTARMAAEAMGDLPFEMQFLFGIWLHPHEFVNHESGDPADPAELEEAAEEAARSLTPHNRNVVFFKALTVAATSVPTSFLYLESSPIARMLRHGVDPSVLSGPPPSYPSDGCGSTALHWLAEMSSPHGGVSTENVVVVARQLLDAGADANARAERGLGGITPLIKACSSAATTNFDLIALYLARGADPNVCDDLGQTAAMHSMYFAVPAAKLLVALPSYDFSVRVHSGKNEGKTLLDTVRWGREHVARISRDAVTRRVLRDQLGELEALICGRLGPG